LIPYGRQEITQADIDAVVEVLESDTLTQGPKTPQFEQVVRHYCEVGYAISVNSATSALHLACIALGLGKGDWFWTTPVTFVASANCGLYCGAKVDFVDIDPITYNISPISLEKKLIEAEEKGRLPKVVIPVHLCGQSSEMERIHKLSQKYGFKIIEDASHAIGGKYMGKSIGGCQYSDITIFSFHPVKIVTTGEGGMAVTNSSKIAEKISRLRSHGITRDPNHMTCEMDGPWYYQQIDLGFNYRITDIQAALGVSQMQRLDQYIARRHQIAERYNCTLDNLPITIPYQHPDTDSAYHLYVIRLNNEISSLREEVFRKLRTQGVNVNVHYIPIYKQPYYQNMGFKVSDYPNAENYYQQAISLPMYPSLSDEQQERVISVMQKLP
jgi:UDP-4-amino-4,6-dideoxy-N-acetyl-beta-L-altrosamine transaminase